MADLQAQKEQTMAKVDKLKKQFKANGIEQPEAILSQPTFAKPEAEQDNPAINQVLYDVGLGKYDDANGQVNAQALIDQTQKIPGLQ
jgi:predicted esterase